MGISVEEDRAFAGESDIWTNNIREKKKYDMKTKTRNQWLWRNKFKISKL